MLDGFIEKFKKSSCLNTDCGKCGYCDAWVHRSVILSDNDVQVTKKNVNSALEGIYSGNVFA